MYTIYVVVVVVTGANNKLHAIYATAGKSIQNNLLSRRDAVIINRLKLVTLA